MIQQQSLSPRAWAELLLLALVWGASFLAFAVALRELPIMTLVAHRVIWGAVALWIFAWFKGIPIPKGAKIWGACLGMGMLNNIIPFSLIAFGQTAIESGLASILNATTAFFGILFAAIAFHDERLTFRKTIGVTLGIIGVIIAMGIDSLRSFDLRSLAQISVLGAAISYGLAGVWARKTMKSLTPESAALGMVTASALMMIPIAFFVDGAPELHLNSATILSLGHLSLIGTALAYLLYYRVLAMAGSGNLMLVTILVVPIAILLGALVLGESLTATAYFGFGILAFGLLVIDGRIWRRFRGH